MTRKLESVARLSLALFASFTLLGCPSAPEPGGPRRDESSVPSETIDWAVPRYPSNRRAILAASELRRAASELTNQLRGLRSGRAPRVAFYYFTRGGKDHLGESIAQQLSSFLVREAGSRVEVYTRRKLSRVAEEQEVQMSDLFDRNTLVKLGRLAGVDAIASGRITKSRGHLEINCQLLAMETAQILGGTKIRIPEVDARPGLPAFAAEHVGAHLAEELKSKLTGSDWKLAAYDITRSKRPFRDGDRYLGDLETALAGASVNVSLYTRSKLDQVIEEHEVEASDRFSESTRAKLGGFVGANAIIAGFAETFRDFHLLNVQVIDVESSRIHAGVVTLVLRSR
ncbi:MAG: hypothetical protein AAF517_17075 [Planctomycetota bacterium]